MSNPVRGIDAKKIETTTLEDLRERVKQTRSRKAAKPGGPSILDATDYADLVAYVVTLAEEETTDQGRWNVFSSQIDKNLGQVTSDPGDNVRAMASTYFVISYSAGSYGLLGSSEYLWYSLVALPAQGRVYIACTALVPKS
jgi:hypothetical protein